MGSGTEESELVPELAAWTLPKAAALALAWAVAIGIAVVDYMPSVELDMSLAYVFPVSFLSRFVSRRSADALGIACAVLDTFVDVSVSRYPATAPFLAWNLAIQSALLLIASRVVDAAHRNTRAARESAARLAVAHRRLDDEIRSVGAVQASLIPEAPPTVPSLEIATHYAPSLRAGGDYYDFFDLPDGRLGILVADASGHGPSAAVLMTMVRVVVRAARSVTERPDRLLDEANRGLRGNLPPGSFVTACYAVVDPRTGAVDLALAGHPPPLVRRARDASTVEAGRPTNSPLGIETAPYVAQRETLEPGDALVLSTDGLVEARDVEGRLLGAERVRECLAACGGGSNAIVRSLVALLERHGGPRAPDDDVTIVVVTRAGGA